jgi:hypothetical protein
MQRNRQSGSRGIFGRKASPITRVAMKWLITAAALASLMTTPVSAARQHLNRDEYWNMTPVAQIFPLGDTWNEIRPRLYIGSTIQHRPWKPLPRFTRTIDANTPRLPLGSRRR